MDELCFRPTRKKKCKGFLTYETLTPRLVKDKAWYLREMLLEPNVNERKSEGESGLRVLV